jgi:hypothetical protein
MDYMGLVDKGLEYDVEAWKGLVYNGLGQEVEAWNALVEVWFPLSMLGYG